MRKNRLTRKEKKMAHQQCKNCRHFGEGCWNVDGDCVNYLSNTDTNFIVIDMTVEVNKDVDVRIFSQYLTNWFDSHGWSYCGSIKPYDEKE